MKTKIYFGFLALLFALGCSNEELINDSSDNSHLRKGNGVNSIAFYGNSILNEYYYPLVELADDKSGFSLSDGKFMRDGKFSGNITGFGNIISNSSKYTFTKPVVFDSPYYDIYDLYNEFSVYYYINATGKISVGVRDNCDISITGILQPGYYAPPDFNDGNIYGGLIDKGKAIITNGTGKLKNLNGTYYVYRGGGINYFGINLSTGEIALQIRSK